MFKRYCSIKKYREIDRSRWSRILISKGVEEKTPDFLFFLFGMCVQKNWCEKCHALSEKEWRKTVELDRVTRVIGLLSGVLLLLSIFFIISMFSIDIITLCLFNSWKLSHEEILRLVSTGKSFLVNNVNSSILTLEFNR